MPASQKNEHADHCDRHRERHPEVERDDVRRQQPYRERQRIEDLVERVRICGVSGGEIWIPERKVATEDRVAKPEMPRPEEETEIADEEDTRRGQSTADGQQRQQREQC